MKDQVKLTRKEKETLASKCGYEYIYSGKKKRGYFHELNDTQNIVINKDDMDLLKKIVKEEENFTLK